MKDGRTVSSGTPYGSGATINPATAVEKKSEDVVDPMEVIDEFADTLGNAADGVEYMKNTLKNNALAINLFEKIGWSDEIPNLMESLDELHEVYNNGERMLNHLTPTGNLKNAIEDSGVDDWLKATAGKHLSKLGSFGDKLTGVVDKLGPVGDVIDIGSSIYENLYEDGNTEVSVGTVVSAVTETAVEKGAGFLGGRGGAWAGAAIGGAVGGPVGAVVGGVIGYVVGSDVGEKIGGAVYDWVTSWW